MRDPVKVEVSSKYQTVSKLKQYMLFVPCKHKVNGFCRFVIIVIISSSRSSNIYKVSIAIWYRLK